MRGKSIDETQTETGKMISTIAVPGAALISTAGYPAAAVLILVLLLVVVVVATLSLPGSSNINLSGGVCCGCCGSDSEEAVGINTSTPGIKVLY